MAHGANQQPQGKQCSRESSQLFPTALPPSIPYFLSSLSVSSSSSLFLSLSDFLCVRNANPSSSSIAAFAVDLGGGQAGVSGQTDLAKVEEEALWQGASPWTPTKLD